jgi:hypothetical protein
MLEHLLRPLGLLSLVSVANGVFSEVLLHSIGKNLHVQLDDARNILTKDVIALADHVQQVNIELVDELVQMLAISPEVCDSQFMALLRQAPSRRSHVRRSSDLEIERSDALM